MKYLFLLTLLIIPGILTAQSKKNVDIVKISTPVKIDGVLDEAVYRTATPAKDFFQLQPYNGQPAFQQSEVYFLYDQTAIYVGAMLYDDPDSIYNFLSERDNIGPSDYFGVYFDPYNQGQLAYGFFITPAGVQTDIKAVKSSEDNEDGSWDAIWESKTKITDKGWVVEMKIPYSALRFPENGGKVWGLNMFRNIRRKNSNNSWNFVDRQVSGFIHQEGIISGIVDIKPPVRLSVSPYASGYVEFNNEESSPDFTYKGGMDLKYGLSESFTLDMMLIPDFGQIQSDDKQLNLSPYELYYSEKRQFFTEGTELFSRGNVFYSRRIGSAPKFSGRIDDEQRESEKIDYNPIETQLLNATKVSGRTNKGWGLGMLNAMSLPSYARLIDTITLEKREVLIQPFTNYNVAVIDKSLKNNSYISLLNTNMTMANDPFRANVTATDFQIRNKKMSVALSGKGGISYRVHDERQTGYFGSLEFAKNSGKLQYGVSQRVVSDKFNPNDMGYIRRNNELNSEVWSAFNVVQPFGIIKDLSVNVWYNHNRVYEPWALSSNMAGINYHNCFINSYSVFASFNISSTLYDYYEPRVAGRYYKSPWSYYTSISANSNYSKPVSVFINAESYQQPDTKKYNRIVSMNLDYRLGRHLQFFYNTFYQKKNNDRGYVDMTDNEDTIYFARRNIYTFENIIGGTYTFNNKAGISVRMRHYWSGAANKEFFRLQENGTLVGDTDYKVNQDENYNAFNVDLIYRWIFAPGSELSVAWKNAIYTSGDYVVNDYWKNLHGTWKSDQINSLSLKILYYLDYNSLRRKV